MNRLLDAVKKHPKAVGALIVAVLATVGVTLGPEVLDIIMELLEEL